MAGERHGNGMGAAWARHAMYESVFSVHKPVAAAARSKEWVCGRSLAGIVGSNLAGGMDVCLLCVVR